jgi:hypothetical protein
VRLKLKIETKMRKGKYASKIKTDHLDREGQLSFSFPDTGYDEEYFLLKFFENNHKCVPFGLFIEVTSWAGLTVSSSTIFNSVVPKGPSWS